MELHEYQKRCANFMALHRNCILSVDMGLGKTASVLAYLNWRKPESVLIVAPKRVAENGWRQEAEKWGWSEMVNKMVICSGSRAKRITAIADKSRPWKIISRDNLKDVEAMVVDVLVIDELTSFKTITAGRTKSILSIKAKQRIGLTGTFLANGAIDIYAQSASVGLFFDNCNNFYGWRASHFRDKLAGSGLQFSKWELVTPLDKLLKPIANDIFTLTAEDYLSIPEVTHHLESVTLDSQTFKAYQDFEAFLGFELKEGEVMTFNEKQKFAKLQTLLNGFVYDDNGIPHRAERSTKLEAVVDRVEEVVEAGEQVLLFYAYREEKAWLEEMLKERGIKFDSVEKRNFLERWNNHESNVLFAHPASAGHGLNLQHGGRVIVWSSLTYNYELFAQANARLARQGQRGNVQIYYFCTQHTCESRIFNALRAKQGEQDEFLRLTKQ